MLKWIISFSSIPTAVLAAFAIFQASNSTGIIPANRMTVWQPGLTYNGGFPALTQCGSTLSPIGGSSDDTAQINSAINSCTSGHYVLLNCGIYNINSGGIVLHASGVVLRGCGPGRGLSTGTNAVATAIGSAVMTTDATATQLIKQDRGSNVAPIITLGWDSTAFSSSISLAADAVQG